MSGLFDRLGAAFLAPATPKREASEAWMEPIPAPAPTGPRAIAVLARPEDARALGAAVALVAAKGTAVLAVWSGDHRPPASARAPATPGARRLAGALERRGHETFATGRLVVVALGRQAGDDDVRTAPDGSDARVALGPRAGDDDAETDPDGGGGAARGADPCAEAVQVAAAAGDVPVTAVLAGPRDERVDAFLRTQERVLLAASDDVLAELALTSLASADVPATRIAAAPTATARALAASGTAVTRELRRRVEEALP